MRFLITGGAGFIGSNLAKALDRMGHSVKVIDNFSTGHRDNLIGFKGNVIEMDMKKLKLRDHFDAIYHFAAITDPRSEQDMQQNVDNFNLIAKQAEENYAKLIYASSANLYGNGPIPMRENQAPEIITEYGRSKLEIDQMSKGVGLRFFNVFGPRESHKGRAASMIYHLANQMKEGNAPRLFKNGEQIRDHIYVTDCVIASILALKAPLGIYNVGTGIGTSFNELVNILNEILGTHFQPEYFDMPYDAQTYQANTHADTIIAEKILGFKALYSLREGIKEYVGGENGYRKKNR